MKVGDRVYCIKNSFSALYNKLTYYHYKGNCYIIKDIQDDYIFIEDETDDGPMGYKICNEFKIHFIPLKDYRKQKLEKITNEIINDAIR